MGLPIKIEQQDEEFELPKQVKIQVQRAKAKSRISEQMSQQSAAPKFTLKNGFDECLKVILKI